MPEFSSIWFVQLKGAESSRAQANKILDEPNSSQTVILSSQARVLNKSCYIMKIWTSDTVIYLTIGRYLALRPKPLRFPIPQFKNLSQAELDRVQHFSSIRLVCIPTKYLCWTLNTRARVWNTHLGCVIVLPITLILVYPNDYAEQ